jgi:D-3-phosphoglycerate dehydrogenase
MKVLIADKLAQEGIDILEQAGYEVDVNLEHTEDELCDIIGAYDALIVRSATTATAKVIEAGKNLKIIGRAGVGVDNIDQAQATKQGIIVCNAPQANTVSAAEQCFALMLAAARHTAQASQSMHEGKWNRGAFSGVELYQKTLAIFGLGHIGQLVAKRAQAFEMRTIGYDPYVTPERAAEMGVEVYSDINDILPQADFITVHLPKTPETIGMFGPAQFAACKKGVIVVNDARGGIYDLEALAAAMESGQVYACGIDVWESEPVSDSPLHALDNAVLTPHLGASTKEAQTRAATQIAEYVIMGLKGEKVPTQVNK